MASFKWSKNEIHRRIRSNGIETLEGVPTAEQASTAIRRIYQDDNYPGSSARENLGGKPKLRGKKRRARGRSGQPQMSPVVAAIIAAEKKHPIPAQPEACREELRRLEAEMEVLRAKTNAMQQRWLALLERSKRLQKAIATTSLD